jgi:hypothetical protein
LPPNRIYHEGYEGFTRQIAGLSIDSAIANALARDGWAGRRGTLA